MDIAAWLRGLGLEQYDRAFRDNDVDAEVLPELADADLEKLGVSLGHRKKLLKAIAALRAAPPSAGDDEPAAPSAAVRESARPDAGAPEAERRQLTVLFSDLVGSTELATRLDPEDMGALIRAYQDAVAGEVARFEGHVAKYMGDGVLAYFGWPKAHEDDAERAVRAGLALIEAVGRLAAPTGEALACRVGIATGLVVVGELVGEGAAREQAVVGETPNLAARLQTLAEPNAVVIARGTRRLVGGLFELQDLGSRALKGFVEPARAWRIIGAGTAESRFEAMHTAALTPLVGREHELGLLLARFELARGGEGQAVLLSGESGIGKSRVIQALRERSAGEPYTRLRYHCSPYHTNSALHPVIDQLERAAGFAPDDAAGEKLDKLEAMVGQVSGRVAEVAPLLAALLSIPTDGRYPALDLTPQAQKAQTFEALLGQLEGLAARQPVLMVLEDAHWLDPTSAELFGQVIDRIQRLPVLLVISCRPEFAPPWTGYPHVTSLTLSRLGRRQGAAIVERLAGGKPLPADVLEQILARTDGVPLFIEELTKAVLESGLLNDAGDHYALSGPLPPLAIPSTLHDSLMARLDRLAPVKEVAQTGATIGREFSYELLAAVASLPDDRLRDALAQLVGSELIFRRGDPPDATYTFKHALVQEAAYGSLLRSRRQELHACIARAVEERFPQIGELQPEWLAHHYTEAGLAAPAADCWLRAGRRAKDAYANREAVSHLRRCLDALASRPAGAAAEAADLEGPRLQALVLLGDLASLAGELEEANRWYGQALAVPAAAAEEVRTWIENKRHRPRITVRDGARIAFYDHGGGRDTLVFVAPLAYGLAAFQPIVERLCQAFRIVTIDSRGTGASDPLTRPYPLSEHVNDVRAVIEALDGGPVVGVGLSRGSNLLFRLAHVAPQLFRQLITIGAPPGPPSPSFFSEERVRQSRDLLERGDLEGVVRLHTSLVFSEPATGELRDLFIRNRLQLPRETILSFFDPDPSIEVTPILAEITVPTLVTHGREDRLVRFAAAEHIAARLPDAQLYAFEGKGHLPLFTATDEFCEVLRSFVRTGTVERPSARRAGSPGLRMA